MGRNDAQRQVIPRSTCKWSAPAISTAETRNIHAPLVVPSSNEGRSTQAGWDQPSSRDSALSIACSFDPAMNGEGIQVANACRSRPIRLFRRNRHQLRILYIGFVLRASRVNGSARARRSRCAMVGKRESYVDQEMKVFGHGSQSLRILQLHRQSAGGLEETFTVQAQSGQEGHHREQWNTSQSHHRS